MNIAREGAWRFANELVLESGSKLNRSIQEKDKKMANYGNYLKGKGWIEWVVLKIIRRHEVGTITEKIEALES